MADWTLITTAVVSGASGVLGAAGGSYYQYRAERERFRGEREDRHFSNRQNYHLELLSSAEAFGRLCRFQREALVAAGRDADKAVHLPVDAVGVQTNGTETTATAALGLLNLYTKYGKRVIHDGERWAGVADEWDQLVAALRGGIQSDRASQ